MKKALSWFLALALTVGCVITALGTGARAAQEEIELFLYLGSPIAMSQGKTLSVDKENPDLAPLLHKDRTLVPLRFVSEFFKAEVSYDAESHTGIVVVNGKTARFPVNEAYYELDGEKIALDTETLEVSGRIFLPLRVLGETVLDLKVDYRDEVVAIGDGIKLDDAKIADVTARIGGYTKVATLAQLEDVVSPYVGSHRGYYDGGSGDMLVEGATADAAESAEAPAPTPTAPQEPAESEDSASGGAEEHSSTNTQVEGVDEADIIKTDGKYIYLVSGQSLRIVKAGESMSLAATVELEDGYANEMYVDGDRVVLIGSRYENRGEIMPYVGVSSEPMADMMMPYYGKSFTFVEVYDTSDMDDVTLLRSFEIEGNEITSRKTGDFVYLLSQESIWNIDEDILRPILGEDGARAAMPIDDIMIMPGQDVESYLTLSAINIQDEDQAVENESIVGSGYTTYMSKNAVYIAMSSNYYWADEMSIARFSVDGSRIGYTGSGQIKGYLNNQFSMDESKGYLRVATTTWDDKSSNNLYVLDENLQVCGSVEGFAPGEQIKSVRFMGNWAYVVTFEQIDPLFVFDLSNPQKPVITGELKIPGFSTHLHPVSEDVLLGIGTDVKDVYVKDDDGKDVVISQQTGGIKLSLFDISDKGKPREIDSLIIGQRGYSEVQSNHKAAMFKESDSLLAFPAELYSYDYEENFSGAFLISYENNRLKELGRIAQAVSKDGEYDYYFGQRLVYIGDTLYYAQNGIIRSFDLDTLRELDSLRLS